MIRSLTLFLIMFAASLSASAGWEEAIASRDVREVKKLLAAGQDANARLNGKRTPLILAAKSGNMHIVNALLAAGADMNAKDEDDETALSEAVKEQQFDVAARLIAAGADTSSIHISGSDAKLPAIVIDAQRFKVDKTVFQTAATRAFLGRDWIIAKREPNRLTGIRLRKDGGVNGVQAFRAEIRHEAPYIIIEFEKGYGYHKPTWLQNLEQDVLIQLETNSVKTM